MEYQFEVDVLFRIDGFNREHAKQRLQTLLQEGEAIVNYGGAGEIGKPMIIARVKDPQIEEAEGSEKHSTQKSPPDLV